MEQSSLLLMKEMISQGHQISLISLTKLGLLSKELDESNIESIGFSYRGPGGILDLRNYRKRINLIKPESIMMTGHSLVGMLALLGRKNQSRVLFVHFHHKNVKPAWLWRIIYSIANKVFDKIYFASNFIMNEAINLYPKIKDKATYLPNPLPSRSVITKDNKALSRARLQLNKNDLVIGNAGWLIQRKRFDVLLNVCAEMKKFNSNIKVLIAGDGEERENLEELSMNLNLSSEVIWLGWQDDLEDFYNSIDIMLFNSDWDAVGLSPLEAIQRGIPTFASVLNGGLKEILNKEFRSFLIEEHDIEVLARKINEGIFNKDKLHELTLRCRDHVNYVSNPRSIATEVLTNLKMQE